MSHQRTKCATCGGGPAHHSGMDNEGCWCPACLESPVIERCHSYRSMPLVTPKRARVSSAKSLPRVGSKRRAVYDFIVKKHGCSDDELEYLTGWSHQSVSAARNSLMEEGLVRDIGERRPNRNGHPAIVWFARP